MLKLFDIDKLEVGMFVESIAKQVDSMKIKSRGRITSQKVIDQLKKQGIKQVVVDLSKRLESDKPEPEVLKPKKDKSISFDAEINTAAKIYETGKRVQKDMFEQVAKNLTIDLSVPSEFTTSLVSSIHRNPDALMCMSKIREKDSYLLEHSLNVAILLANFSHQLGLEDHQVQELALSGFLHDIGKINIPDKILHKPGRLTDEEMVIMRKHVQFGTDVLLDMEIPSSIIRTIGEHHERLDGLGYPEQRKGAEISTFGRMIAIADTYDAITATRCYKAGMPSKKALQILLKDSPVKYDKELVLQFVKSVGIYPVGTLVKLDNEKLAMVMQQHQVESNKPKIKVFYSVKGSHYLAPLDVDLAAPTCRLNIVEAVTASDYKIDFNKYFKESIAIT
ncbi:HD-GYP domain-containing protein [Paraglaciecola aquimarina]|uniref:HD-GYP domain-containing protein n=1 Tax=Paraglaciecola algarum TaxID=3050085 RepID=A0ABS9D2T9_9ALTE|nr:HD-GYP domain-containing protein [Paraglaciecola sp. G1-23]